MIEAHNITNLEGNSLENAIKEDFGFEVTNLEKITKGYASQVYKASLEGKEVFIRINKDPNVFEVEEVGYKIFEEKGIPVPKIIAYKENPKSIGYPTMIMSSAEGTVLGEANVSLEQKDIIYEKLGKLLKKIHETKLKGFGSLRVENEKLVGKHSTWKEFSESLEEHHNKAFNFAIKNNLITEEDGKKIQEIYKEISLLDIREASLIHKDMHHGHFFVKGSDITGIIDLGSLKASDPRYDIATSLVFQNQREQEFFKKGYGELANDPIVNKHLITILIRKIYFRSKEEIKGNVEILLTKLKDAIQEL
jgi:aminoglycoside phosphotransferase (APT) family kinase protein